MNQSENKQTEKKQNILHILWQLFTATFTLSAFTFGGGFVIASLMKRKFSDELGWFSEKKCWISQPLPSLLPDRFRSMPLS